MSTTSKKSIEQVLAAFENGNIPQAIAYSTFTPPGNIPACKWTKHNRALAFLQGTGDARGFNQWKEVGRHVKKGTKSIYILGPVLKKSNGKGEIEDLQTAEKTEVENLQCVGYYGISVFRVEDTEGEPLEYITLDTKTLPLADVAEKWGIDIKTGAFNSEYYAYYSNSRKEIVMVTDDNAVFFHELAHAAHYRIDPKANKADTIEKEIIAELSAAALCQITGKQMNTGNHYRYIKSYAELKNLSLFKACMKVLDTCIKVIDEIIKASENYSSSEKVA